MTSPALQPPRIEFRMELTGRSGAEVTKLQELYRHKLAAVMREVRSAPLNPVDYDDLPALRAALAVRPTFQDLDEVLFSRLSDDRLRLLIDAAPIFNACQVEQRAFILLAFGVRSHHLN